jgi:preprotein translocase subunit SecF
MLKYSKFYFAFSGVLMLASILGLVFWGLNLGIEFTGGSLLEVKFQVPAPSVSQIKQSLAPLNLAEFQVLSRGDGETFLIRAGELSEKQHQQLLENLRSLGVPFEESSFQVVGPVIGKELKNKSLTALIIGLLGVVFYVSWVFRRARTLVRAWQYGAVVLVTLFHDVLITVGIFAILAHFYNYSVGVPFVASVLMILGYSVNDTIVVFDRIRERLMKTKKVADFKGLVGKSLREVLARSLNTSLSTLLVLIALILLGGETLIVFTLVLIIGIIIGTYSSLLIAAPLLLKIRGFLS